MKKTIALLLALGPAPIPILAQTITLDYAHGFDFSSVETCQVVRNEVSGVSDALTDSRVRNAIIRELFEGGLHSASSSPDLFVTYRMTSDGTTLFNETVSGLDGFHDGWGAWKHGADAATTSVSTYSKGTLIVDAYAPDHNGDMKLVWRGVGLVKATVKPRKQQKQIDKILAKLGKRWAKILAGQGK